MSVTKYPLLFWLKSDFSSNLSCLFYKIELAKNIMSLLKIVINKNSVKTKKYILFVLKLKVYKQQYLVY